MIDPKRIEKELNSVRHCWSYEDKNQCPPTLQEALNKKLSHIESSSWEDRFLLGGVYINGVRTLENTPLLPPVRIEYFEPKYNYRAIENHFPSFKQDYIIYEDEYIVAVFKPPKLPSTPSREQATVNLKSFLEKYLKTKIHMPSRLDSASQGLVLVSKSPKTHALLQKIFEKRELEKYYILEIPTSISWEHLSVKTKITYDTCHPVLRKTSQEIGKTAITQFSLLFQQSFILEKKKIPTSVLQAQIFTGRTHQLRVHAKHIGASIIGDNFYDGLPSEELRLLSYRVKFIHPIFETQMDIKVPFSLLPPWLKGSLIR